MILKLKNLLNRIWNLKTRPEMLVLPGQLAFFFLLAIVPTVTLLAYGASFFNISVDFLTNFMTKAFGENVSSLVMPIMTNIDTNLQFFLTIFIGFYTASSGAASIIITSNEMYGIPNSSFIHRKVKAIFITFILVFLLIFLLFIPVFGDQVIVLLEYVNLNANVTKVLSFGINVIKGPISLFIIFFLIKIIYTLAPDKVISSRTNTYGSLFTTFGFGIATMIYSFYVNNFSNYANVYGGLAQFVVLMVWLYILAYIFVIGLAINTQKMEKIGDIEKEN